MAIAHSPLRYPGGKQILSRVVAHLIHLNGARGGTYAEPYAGGAGVAFALLLGEHVDRVLINDADLTIYAFWTAALSDTEAFLKLLKATPPTIDNWTHQRSIYQQPGRFSRLRVGFATFFLNRCNRSGIIASGGPIGGQKQTGNWKIDARWNPEELERRIRKLAMYRDRIEVSNEDGIQFLANRVLPLAHTRRKPFAYLDPPYYLKGRDLYLSYYEHEDHARLASFLATQRGFPWALTYDSAPEIKRLYDGFRQVRFSIDYSARTRSQGSEIMILPPDLIFPAAWVRSIPRRFISSAEDAPVLPMA